MNIKTLKLVIKDLESISVSSSGKKFLLNEAVKLKLPLTNFQLLGEDLCIHRNEGIGKSDLWLANCKSKFLLNLDLKIGSINDINKQELLVKQMHKYSKLMQVYYPKHTVYGLGVYKYSDNYKFFDTLSLEPIKKHASEINLLKDIITKC